jgi:hypothetical protein
MKRRSPRSGISAALLGAAVLLAAAPVRAQQAPPPKEKPWYEAITLGVFLESTYTENSNHPDSSTNQFRVFDTVAGSIRLDVAEVVVQRKASASGETGFRIDALAGSSIPHVTAASGLFRDDATGKAGDFDLLQSFATWVAPLGRGLKLDAGKFTTHMGYEVVDGPDGYNDNVSRSFLYGWAVPISHVGLRATYPVTDSFSMQAVVVSGWDDATDNNGKKSVGAQLLYTPIPAVTVAVNVMTGPEKPQNDSDRRDSLDTWASWKVSGRWSFAVNADYGTEDGDETGGGGVWWGGVAGYARVTLHERFAVSVRAEFFRDPDGERTGTKQTLREVTITPEWKPAKGVAVRGEVRHDWSDAPVFEQHGGTSKSQTTAALNVVYVY